MSKTTVGILLMLCVGAVNAAVTARDYGECGVHQLLLNRDTLSEKVVSRGVKAGFKENEILLAGGVFLGEIKATTGDKAIMMLYHRSDAACKRVGVN